MGGGPAGPLADAGITAPAAPGCQGDVALVCTTASVCGATCCGEADALLEPPVNDWNSQPSCSSLSVVEPFGAEGGAGGTLAQPPRTPKRHANSGKSRVRPFNIEDFLVPA